MNRIEKIDIVRGIVMVIMALDHVRDILHVDALTQNPTNLNYTTPILFFTRWITHLCAPTFVFLAGTSAFLYFSKTKSVTLTRTYLIKRGLILILLEFTIINFGLFFDAGFHSLLFQVIATIGFGMIILGILISLNPKTIGIIGLIILVFHNLTPLIPFAGGSVLKTIFTPLFSPTAFPLFNGITFIMGYPPVPWLGILLIGYATGKYFLESSNRVFLKFGIISIGLFLLLRFLNIYGDPILWTPQKSAVYTLLSFFNVTKYPPSLLFCLITLGIMFLLIVFAEKINEKVKNILLTFGKVPLFYFIVHFYLIHTITLAVLFAQGFNWSQLSFASGTFGHPQNIESGISLGWVYLVWTLVVFLMYFPSKWYAAYKATHKYSWLKYI